MNRGSKTGGVAPLATRVSSLESFPSRCVLSFVLSGRVGMAVVAPIMHGSCHSSPPNAAMQAAMSCATRALARAPCRLNSAAKSFAAPRAAAFQHRPVALHAARRGACFAAADQVSTKR